MGMIINMTGKKERDKASNDIDILFGRIKAAFKNIVRSRNMDDFVDNLMPMVFVKNHIVSLLNESLSQLPLSQRSRVNNFLNHKFVGERNVKMSVVEEKAFPNMNLWKTFDDFIVVAFYKTQLDICGYHIGYASSGRNVVTVLVYDDKEKAEEDNIYHNCSDIIYDMGEMDLNDISDMANISHSVSVPINVGGNYVCRGCGENYFFDIVNRKILFEYHSRIC